MGRFKQVAVQELERSFGKLRDSVSLLDEQQLWWRPNARSNSVGNLLQHLAGNLSEWVLKSLGGQAFERQRDQEFAGASGASRDELLRRLERVVAASCEVILGLPEAELLRRQEIRGSEVDGLEACFHVVEHFGYHTGQVAYVVKQLLPAEVPLDLTAAHPPGRRP